MTARGLAMRSVSIVCNLALLALVTPVELGLYAVAFGMAGIVQFTSDLGVGKTLLRRERRPTDTEYAALAGLQLLVIGVVFVIGWISPALALGFGAVDRRWHGWMMLMIGAMFALPFGAPARIRLERALEYRRLAVVDVLNVVVQNVGLLAFAIIGRFTVGIFIVLGLMQLVVNGLLYHWSPGPRPTVRVSTLRPLANQSTGYMAAGWVTIAKDRVTPVLVANLFGLGVAGLWTFAVRLAQLLNVTFEGFRQAAVPAAALLTSDRRSLRDLASQTLRGTVMLAAPLAAIVFVCLPVIGIVWRQWSPAIGLAQIAVLCFAFAGVAGAVLEPVAVAVRGATVSIGEQLSTAAVAWTGFVALHATGSGRIASVVLPMNLAPVIVLLLLTDRAVRPHWEARLNRSLLSLATGLAIYFVLRATGANPLVVAAVSVAGVVAWIRPRQVMSRLRRGLARPAPAGAET